MRKGDLSKKLTPTRWQQIEEVFQSALDLAPAERQRFVLENCHGDEDLKREVEKLIAQYEEADKFIESPVWTDSLVFNSGAKREFADSFENKLPPTNGDRDPMIGRRVGVYRLTKELGRGGMGAVYLAERADGEFRQKVAIKLIKRGMDTDFIVRRFRHERQILAALDHPNIARLLDGGTTEDGLPYFVMEFIEGEPLYRYCDARKLSVKERLQLFGQVCSAVHAAHERHVIHRDIKPGNILVTAAGIPKLLDFGIAKILDPDLIHESINPTSTMMRLMTPDYASPEQVCGTSVTPASDVYALGILLYEVLTGHRPYGFTGRSPHEISRVICEVEPPQPSMAVRKAENLLPVYLATQVTAEKAAELRSTTLTQLESELAGDLDNIVLKALRKKPEARYDSVEEFSADIFRHLKGETVAAPRYIPQFTQTEKSVTDAVPTGDKSIAVLPFKLLNILSDENTGDKFLGLGLADALITRLSNIRRFIVRPTSSVLRYGEGQFDPFVAGKELGVQFIIDGHIQKAGGRIRVSVQLLNVAERTTVWAERFDEKFTDVLSLEDAISTQVATALISRLTDDEREQLLKRGTNNSEAFEAYLRGRYHWNTFTEEGFAKAIVAYNQAVALDPNYALAFAGIADYYCWLGIYGVLPSRECFMAAEEAATRAIEIDPGLSEAYAALGFSVLGGNYDWKRGEAACRRALELNPNNAQANVWYSLQLLMEGRFDEGVRHAKLGLELDPLTPFNQHHLGWGLYFARRFDESIAQYQKMLVANPLYPMAYFGYSWVLRFVGRYDESIKAIQRGMELSTDSMFMLSGYGQALAAAGRREEALEVLRQLEDFSGKRNVSPYHMAVIYAYLSDHENALRLLEKAFAEREAWVVWMGVEPVFDSLRAEPRFVNLLEQTDNPAFYRANTINLQTGEISLSTDGGIIQRTHETDLPTGAPTSNRRLKWAAVAASVLLPITALGYFGSQYVWKKSEPQIVVRPLQPDETKGLQEPHRNYHSLAVLPFTTLGAESDDAQYLGVGTADLVANKLSQLDEVNLRSASSVRRYLNSAKSAVEIGRELAVDFVIKGSIERVGEQVIAKLEMTDVATGNVVWNDNFNEPNSNLFALQDTISERIAASLSLHLSNSEKQQLNKHFTENNEAHQLYLAGRYHFGKRSVEGLKQAISLFNQAIEKDPNFSLAYTGMADCYALLNLYQEPPPPDAWEKARQAAARAVALDESLAEAHASLAFIKFHYERDYRGAEDEFRRAINLKPNYATAHQWYAFFLSARERHDEAIAVMRQAEQLDPRSAVIASAVANVLFLARQYDEAIVQCRKSLEIDPGSMGTHVILRWTYEKKGMGEEALAIYEKELAFGGNTPTSRAKYAHVLAAIGRREESRKVLDELIRSRQVERVTPYEIAIIYSFLEDYDKAIEWLKKAKDERAFGFSFVRVDPLLDNVRKDPRFAPLLP